MRQVLVVENDPGIVGVVELALTTEGYAVTATTNQGLTRMQDLVEQLAPACVLLGGNWLLAEDDLWSLATWLAARTPPVPVVMFTGDLETIQEAEKNESARSQAAGFSAVLGKPFEIDDLLAVVASAVTG
jgi:CheY-like chemotaxis protein